MKGKKYPSLISYIINRKGDEIFSFIKQKQSFYSYLKSFGGVFYYNYMEIRLRMTKIDRNK